MSDGAPAADAAVLDRRGERGERRLERRLRVSGGEPGEVRAAQAAGRGGEPRVDPLGGVVGAALGVGRAADAGEHDGVLGLPVVEEPLGGRLAGGAEIRDVEGADAELPRRVERRHPLLHRDGRSRGPHDHGGGGEAGRAEGLQVHATHGSGMLST